MVSETLLVTINNQLRFVLFGLECALDVEFSVEAAEKIFFDSAIDMVSEKRYTFWTGPTLIVTGLVEEYEPGDVLLTVKSVKAFSPSLLAILERAKYQVYRLEQREESEAYNNDADNAAVD